MFCSKKHICCKTNKFANVAQSIAYKIFIHKYLVNNAISNQPMLYELLITKIVLFISVHDHYVTIYFVCVRFARVKFQYGLNNTVTYQYMEASEPK